MKPDAKRIEEMHHKVDHEVIEATLKLVVAHMHTQDKINGLVKKLIEVTKVEIIRLQGEIRCLKQHSSPE